MELNNFQSAKTKIKMSQEGCEEEVIDNCVIYPHPDSQLKGWYVALSEETSTVWEGPGVKEAYTGLIETIVRTIKYMFTDAPDRTIRLHSESEYFLPNVFPHIGRLDFRTQQSWLEELVTKFRNEKSEITLEPVNR